MLAPIPYLAVQVERWGERREIQLPDDAPFGTDLGLLIDVIRMANKVNGWEKLIPTYRKRMVDYIHLAD